MKELELKYEERRQRDFVNQVFYPFLLANSKSIDDAKNLVYACDMALQQTFHMKVTEAQKEWSKRPVKDLKMDEVMDQSDQFARDRALIELFKDEPLSTATVLLSGMRTAIEGFEREESTKRDLSTLQTDFLQ